MSADYSKTAWFYDALSRMVFGNALNLSQAFFLSHIPEGANVLIVGGGTGKILEDIALIHPNGLQITYVEISATMIALSQKRNVGDNTIDFLTQPAENLETPGYFDVVITPFLLDNYTSEQLPGFIAHISKQLKPSGLWLNTDFQLTGKWWQKVLLKTMYGFFKLFADIKTSALPDFNAAFADAGYQLKAKKDFYGDFVGAQVWMKADG
ncbi:MAG: class I SAM-dependent methyltransferase [Sphingobacteriaceae bacterium]|nr:MAG: class I SAM-dependent methyltransferase [Sphingobacteriaceae bacterium]